MPRVRKGAARHQAKKRLFKAVRGFRGPRSKNLRLAKEALVRTKLRQPMTAGKKRQFRALWITRLSAACASRDIRYSRFIFGMKLSQISINRKMLSELAIHDPQAFDAVTDIAKKAIEAAG